jgi:hypothetical protein
VRPRPDEGEPSSGATPVPTLHGLSRIHSEGNDLTAGHWALYDEHRRHLSTLIAGHGPRHRLAVLGAGNANDLDLDVLAARFVEIHLADLDGAALARAARRQSPATRERLTLHAERDLSGLLDRLPGWRANAPDAETLARAAPAAAARVVAGLPGPFDLVVSDCLMSQIAWTCFCAFGDTPMLMAIVTVALAAHLRALVALTRPGGRCLLVTDVISSDTYPLDRTFPQLDGGALLRRLDRQGRLFSGTSPALTRMMLEDDPDLAREVEDVSVVAPWTWGISPRRTLLVCAVAFARRKSVRT